MIIIADSGATKTSWAAVDGDTVIRFGSAGCNPNYIEGDDIASEIRAALREGLDPGRAEKVFFYCAGISSVNGPAVRESLGKIFGRAEIECESDLLGAARALLGRNPGLAAILGTGANSCLYDGEGITAHVDCMGFILGDEGSGAYIGKHLICDYLRRNMPDDVIAETGAAIGLGRDGIIERIYRRPAPNRFCADLCRFIGANIGGNPYYRNLVMDSFRAFFDGMICRYEDWRSYGLSCTGSIAHVFREELCEVAGEYGINVEKVLKEPLEGLVAYHCGGAAEGI